MKVCLRKTGHQNLMPVYSLLQALKDKDSKVASSHVKNICLHLMSFD